jgi:ketosteroid isomerase-like protein
MKTLKIISMAIMAALASCSNGTKNWEKEIIDADNAFSDYSVKHGQIAAFLQYAAPDVVLIKPNMYPIVGHEKLKESYQGKSDTTYVLTWEPQFARVAKSGDLGYTYGYWKLVPKAEPEKFSRGTYATVWHRQPDGQWKFVLDLGNQGLGDE